MTKLPQYTTIAKDAFSQYLNNQTDLYTLIERLQYIELQAISDDEDEVGKGLWFRFFEGDPLQTSISEIEKDLRNHSHPNYNILRQGIALGLANDELEVHYS